jgi:uncharacterized Tic20 family protein
MQPYETYRIGHVERDAVVERLAAAYAEGRIDAAEFDQRATTALNARTQADLMPLLTDIPAGFRPGPLPTRAPTVPLPPSTSAERAWGMLAHFSAWFLFFIGPLLFLLTVGRSSNFVRRQAAEALNFQLSFLGLNLILIVGVVVTLGLGALLYPVIWLAWLVLILIGGIASLAGSPFRYPLTLRLVR